MRRKPRPSSRRRSGDTSRAEGGPARQSGNGRGRPVERGGGRRSWSAPSPPTPSRSRRWTQRGRLHRVQGRPFPRGRGARARGFRSARARHSTRYDPSATRSSTCPTQLRRRRTDDVDRDRRRCVPGHCRAYVTPAGGGVWRTKNALAGDPHWEYLGGPLGINAAGVGHHRSRTIRAAKRSTSARARRTSAAPAASPASVSTSRPNGGDTWTGPLGKHEFAGKGIGDDRRQARRANTIYVGDDDGAARHVVASAARGVTRPVPGAAKWGLYKSTDGGATWAFIHNGSANAGDCTGDLTEFNNGRHLLAARRPALALDPSNPDIVYAASYARGVWRSTGRRRDLGADQAVAQRGGHPVAGAIAVTTLPTARRGCTCTRATPAHPSRACSAATTSRPARPVFTDLTSASTADPGWAWFNLCDGAVLVRHVRLHAGGLPGHRLRRRRYSYGETVANKRGVILSTDAGVSGTDMTFDGTDPLHPNGLHPDQHAIVTMPGNPFQFIEANDGGVMRSSGEFVDRSSWCDDPNRGLTRRHARPLPADALAHPVEAREHQQRAVHAPVPEPVGQPARRQRAPGRHAGQRHLGDRRQPGDVGEHDDRRRRPVRLRRRASRSSGSTTSPAPRRT